MIERFNEAEPLLNEALQIFRATNNPSGEGATLNSLGRVAFYHGHLDDARSLCQNALGILQNANDIHGEANSLTELAEVARKQRRFDEANDLTHRALGLLKQVHDTHDEAAAYALLGEIAADQGYGSKAKGLYEQALTTMRALNARRDIALILELLGSLAVAQDKLTEAAQYYAEAQQLFHEVIYQSKEADAYYWLGCIALRQAKRTASPSLFLEQAEASFADATLLYSALGNDVKLGVIKGFLADIACLKGDNVQAVALYQSSLQILRQSGDQINYSMGVVKFGVFLIETLHDRERGCRCLTEARTIQSQVRYEGPILYNAESQSRRLRCFSQTSFPKSKKKRAQRKRKR
jgi:predicted negative regulator of RcsB-dependent stress response